VRLLNGQFDALTLPQTVDAIFGLLAAGERAWLCTVNVAILMAMRGDPRLQSFVDRAALVVADGQPLVWCASWFGHALPERVTGIDLIDAVCERAAREGKRLFLLGATADSVARAAQRLRSRYRGLQLDCADGYFANDQALGRAAQIRASGAHVLFVGMGSPRQERFIEEHWQRLGVGVAVGVGGSFDVLAGVCARAPVWMRKIGMEWFFRMAQEPRRLFKRYRVTNSQFVLAVLDELLRSH